MNEQKSLLLEIAEAIDRRLRQRGPQEEDVQPVKRRPRWLRWLARQMVLNIGTLLMVVALLLTIPSLAAPLLAPSATSTSTISYQGRLADAEGNPLTDTYPMVFRIYDVPTGGVPLWTEHWDGGNSVKVSDGLFNVMLGSIDNTLASSIEGHDELYLGIAVSPDSEMEPRVQLGSVPFSFQAQQALTVPDGSITTGKIADGAVTTAKLDIDSGLTVNGGITLTGTLDGPTSHWADYRAYLRFLKEDGVTAADLCPEGGTPVGVVGPKQSLEWTTGDEICQHNHNTAETACLNVHQIAPGGSIIGNYYPYSAEPCSEDFSGKWAPFYWWNAQPSHDVSNNILGSGIGCVGVKYACCTSP